MIGTTLGGIIGAIFKSTSKNFLSFILQLSAGLMTAIICFDLIPESLNYSNLTLCLLGILLGIIAMIICDEIISKLDFIKKYSNNSLFKTGIVIFIGLTIHNFPERISHRFRF